MWICAGSRICLRCRYRWGICGTWIREPALSWAPAWTTRTKKDNGYTAGRAGLTPESRHCWAITSSQATAVRRATDGTLAGPGNRLVAPVSSLLVSRRAHHLINRRSRHPRTALHYRVHPRGALDVGLGLW